MSASVASKYANLPDIDTAQPDVYETPDVAVADGPDGHDDEGEIPLSEDISTQAVAAGQAASRFRAAVGDVDASSAMARYQRSLFRTLQLESLAGDKEVLSGSGQDSRLKETPEQRLRRLVYETQELKEQMAAGSAAEPTRQSVPLMRLVNGLNDELAHLAAQSEKYGSTDSSLMWEALDAQAAEKPQRSVQRSPAATGDAALLEKRLAALEKLVGAGAAQSAKDTSIGHSLADAVGRLRQQMDILADPQRVDGIQRRIKQALVEMDRLDVANAQATKAAADAADGKGANATVRLDPATIKRIDELYEKLTNVDSLIELAPATARRLQSLGKLHSEAAEAVARVGRIEGEQANMSEELVSMRDVATSLRSAMGENTAVLRENVASIDSRIADLSSRLAALSK
ncbi:hypothetical protein GGF46_004125 [Coemansia sp. RSA 552]|nr:hypothetical protein GGF46_004125 [Coemansia sp. RSA 552]